MAKFTLEADALGDLEARDDAPFDLLAALPAPFDGQISGNVFAAHASASLSTWL